MTALKPHVGDIRASQILYTYGVGLIVDLPDFSVLVMGLDDWPANNDAMRPIVEDRLLAAVNAYGPLAQVTRFLAPPVDNSGNPWDPQSDMAVVGVPVATFPRWMVCTACRLLMPIDSGLFTIKSKNWSSSRRYVHVGCNQSKDPPVVPARFLVACEDGHLDDFPWVEYVHGAAGPCTEPILRLFERGVWGKRVTSSSAAKAVSASGAWRKHLASRTATTCHFAAGGIRTCEYDPNGCTHTVKPLVLGASNAWFPLVFSSIAIPGGTQHLDQLVDENWAVLQFVTSLAFITPLRQMGQLNSFSSFSDSQLWEAIQRRRQPSPEDDSIGDLRLPEWRIFTAAQATPNTPDFRLRPVAPPAAYRNVIDRVVLVERMREVKTLTGFTRIDSPGEGLDVDAQDEISTIAPLSRRTPTWLPAVEVRGEGIFLQFAEERIVEWLGRAAVGERGRAFNQAHVRWCRARGIDVERLQDPGMRYVLLHSFSHALMRQLALESGYAAASISERIYDRDPDVTGGPMAGILLYTAASDSDGTLGGLVRLGQTTVLERHIAGALESMTLCASDPTCAEHEPSNDGMSLHAAACHACLFAPETACERGNRYLDRSVLVGTFAQNTIAFFGERL